MRQFRLAAHLANGRGNLVEIVAGHVEADEQPAEAARRECVEEIGVAPGLLVELFTYPTSPGMSDEEITLFLGIVDASGVPERAGAAAEHRRDRADARPDRCGARRAGRRHGAQRPADHRAAMARAQPRATERDVRIGSITR